jgi:hypothetical protein
MSNFLKRLMKLVDHDVKANRNTLQSPSTEQNMIEAGRDLTIYDGIFNYVNGTLTLNQTNHDNRGSGMLPDLASHPRMMSSQLADLWDNRRNSYPIQNDRNRCHPRRLREISTSECTHRNSYEDLGSSYCLDKRSTFGMSCFLASWTSRCWEISHSTGPCRAAHVIRGSRCRKLLLW